MALPSNLTANKMNKTKTIIIHKNDFITIVLVQINFMQHKQFNETRVISHTFKQIQI